MEYCSGGELFERLIEEGNFTEQDARIIFKQMIDALNYSHTRKIVHRDLKPENFMFLDKNRDSIIKLIDFGFSKMYEENVLNVMDLKLKTKCGTAYYMAPEVLTGKYSEKCDIYSLGIILYVLLSGYPPFMGSNDKEILANAANNDVEFNGPEWNEVSKEAMDLITIMTHKDMNQRPGSQEVIFDKWLSDHVCLKDSKLKLNIIRLQQFANMNKLKKITLTYMASKCTENEIGEIHALFKQIDTNSDGQLSYEEMINSLRLESKDTYTMTKIISYLEEIDTNCSGQIDYIEFIAAIMGKSY